MLHRAISFLQCLLLPVRSLKDGCAGSPYTGKNTLTVSCLSYLFKVSTYILQEISGHGISRGVGSTVACKSALRSAGTLLSQVRALPSRSPCRDWLYTITQTHGISMAAFCAKICEDGDKLPDK
ncbi:hypothetical protein PoB_001845900 [Plakobranchus ocellatus]|uniref:Secreted protein n=1 Tax=Plakobranchus ocellatus TaxID=259542 RepID=A0AAV3ZC62_9GAST|nr:hypothetical protein PoB_001845900 [Plakobranchus ocellatus]